MPVHSLHIFDRKGKTLFTKKYVKVNRGEEQQLSESELAEQRKLVFGMLFSLREVASSLSPTDSGSGGKENGGGGGLHSVKTDASTLYNYETGSGLRFALYVTDESTNPSHANSIRNALSHCYNELWINYVTRSPLYTPTNPNVKATNFEKILDDYFASHPWFR